MLTLSNAGYFAFEMLLKFMRTSVISNSAGVLATCSLTESPTLALVAYYLSEQVRTLTGLGVKEIFCCVCLSLSNSFFEESGSCILEAPSLKRSLHDVTRENTY